jgi:hypothetical protein
MLEVKWPVLLDDTQPLKLVTRGAIVWSEDGVAAMRIENWEFHTQNMNGL